VIDTIPGVQESAVIGVSHPDFGEAVTAIVVPDGSVTIDEGSLEASLGGQLARFKQPKRFFLIDALPRNSMGKVQKNELRRAYRDTYGALHSGSATELTH
jgi:malonyl-CoA/methylmalonyl-CoA synthetase